MPKNVCQAAKCPNCYGWWAISEIAWYYVREEDHMHDNQVFCTPQCKHEYVERGEGREIA